MRFLRAGFALTVGVAALLTFAQPAAAATPTGGWTDPEPSDEVDGIPLAVLEEEGPLKGVADFDGDITSVSFRLTQDGGVGAADPCSAIDDVQPQTKTTDSTHVVFSFVASFPCNYRYQVMATVTPADRPLRQDSPLELPLWIDVAIPPAPTEGLTASLVNSRRAASLRWDDAPHEVDFTGFEIRRSVEGSKFVKVGTAGTTATSFVDEDLPATGGVLKYRVLGMRSGPRSGSTIYGGSDSAAVALEPVGGGTTGGDGGSGSGSGSGGDGSTGTTSTTSGGGGGGGGRADTSGMHTPLPGSGTRTVVGRATTPTTVDTGYQDTLPFRPREPSEQEALPAGDPAVVARIDDDDDDPRQTALLVAGAGVAFSWAMALRLLSRRFSGI